MLGLESAQRSLTKAIENYVEPEPLRCAVCGTTEDENDMPLLDVTVEVSQGEEGWDRVMLWYCDVHAWPLLKQIQSLGFNSHRHGGINFLEDRGCIGSSSYGACLTPTEDD